MFDNEIDWVKRILSALRDPECREAPGKAGKRLNVALIQGRAHAIELVQVTDSGKCSSKKSVFRSYGDYARERTRPCSEAKNRLPLIRTEVIRLPALELILWSSY
jgi:hypothetical protein